jgi:hypothetical protein
MTNHEQTERSAEAGLYSVVRLPNCAPDVEEGPVPEVLATVLSVGVTVGPWFPLADGRGWYVLLAAAVVALIALLRFIWLHRARSTRRKAALDAYAEREIARDRHGKTPPLNRARA